MEINISPEDWHIWLVHIRPQFERWFSNQILVVDIHFIFMFCILFSLYQDECHLLCPRDECQHVVTENMFRITMSHICSLIWLLSFHKSWIIEKILTQKEMQILYSWVYGQCKKRWLTEQRDIHMLGLSQDLHIRLSHVRMHFYGKPCYPASTLFSCLRRLGGRVMLDVRCNG